MRNKAELAARYAEKVVREKRITKLPVDPRALATASGIEVVPKAVKGVSGMLIALPGNEFLIGYATHLGNEGFENFSIAHELGHFFLEGHPEYLFSSASVHESHAGFVSDDAFEREADYFAAGVLMPAHLFEPAIQQVSPGFSGIAELAARCKTSLTATAIRYAELSEDEPVAIVMTENQRVCWWCGSAAFKRIPGITWLRKGDLLPPASYTAEFNKDKARVERGERWERTSSIPDWFGEGPHRALAEDVVGLGGYGKTLTVLFAEDSEGWPDDEVEADEDDAPAWNPTFHRSRRR